MTEYSTFQKLQNMQTARVHGAGQHLQQAEAAESASWRQGSWGYTKDCHCRVLVRDGAQPLCLYKATLAAERQTRERIQEATAAVLASE